MKGENNSGYIKSVILPPVAGFFRKMKDSFCACKFFYRYRSDAVYDA